VRRTPSRSTRRRPCSAPRQAAQRREITPDQRLFLRASPAFDLSLGGHRILDAFEILMEDEGYRPTAGGVAVECAGLMFGETLLKADACGADILRAIGAAQDVEINIHLISLFTSHPSRRRLTAAPQDEEFSP